MGKVKSKPQRTTTDVIEIAGRRFLDPFDIPASYAGRIDPALDPAIFRIIETRYKGLLEEAFTDPQVRGVLLCDGEVVERAAAPDMFTEEHIQDIQRQRGKLCFVVGKGDLVEESAWNTVDAEDSYPTLRVWLAPADVDDADLLAEGEEVVADFDTGNPRHPVGYHAFDDAIRQKAWGTSGAPRVQYHLGSRYSYRLAPAKRATGDEHGAMRAGAANVRFVGEWTRSPFVLPSPGRRGFVGREIMFALGLRITLDPSSRQTRVDFV